ncbi:MAG TPA: C40 family peptidase [Thermoanaerobaculia bacterium]|nr:C40 family peptidase [Thermoanaerobaculia bacterium]
MIGPALTRGLIWLLSVGSAGTAVPAQAPGVPAVVRFPAQALHAVVDNALGWLGSPYRMGGSARSGIDCSGLVRAVYGSLGVVLPRTAAGQFHQGVPVPDAELRPGDLVFFENTYKSGISHVGIYIGDGRFVHAAGRKRGVVVTAMAEPYFRSRFIGARRLLGGEPVRVRQVADLDPEAPAPMDADEAVGSR